MGICEFDVDSKLSTTSVCECDEKHVRFDLRECELVTVCA